MARRTAVAQQYLRGSEGRLGVSASGRERSIRRRVLTRLLSQATCAEQQADQQRLGKRMATGHRELSKVNHEKEGVL